MSKKDSKVEEVETNHVAEIVDKPKEETIPVKIKEAYDSLLAQVKQFSEQKIQATTMETKAVGALEVLLQMYPALREPDSEG